MPNFPYYDNQATAYIAKKETRIKQQERKLTYATQINREKLSLDDGSISRLPTSLFRQVM